MYILHNKKTHAKVQKISEKQVNEGQTTSEQGTSDKRQVNKQHVFQLLHAVHKTVYNFLIYRHLQATSQKVAFCTLKGHLSEGET